MYESFRVFIDEEFPKIVLQSQKIQRNENGFATYPSITLYEGTYANDIYDETIGIWYGKRLVKIRHELEVPCVPMLRIFFKHRYVTIINDDRDSFDLLCNQIIAKIQKYEIMSINKPTFSLQWIEQDKNIVLSNGIPLCRVHQCKVKKQKPKIVRKKSTEIDLSFDETRGIYFPNSKYLVASEKNEALDFPEEIYVCTECNKEKLLWEKEIK